MPSLRAATKRRAGPRPADKARRDTRFAAAGLTALGAIEVIEVDGRGRRGRENSSSGLIQALPGRRIEFDDLTVDGSQRMARGDLKPLRDKSVDLRCREA